MTAHRPAVAVEPLMTTAEVAAHLRVSDRTVKRRLVDLGAIRIGRQVRFRRADVLAYEERQQMQAVEPTPIRAVEPSRVRRVALTHDTPTNPISQLPWGVSRDEASR